MNSDTSGVKDTHDTSGQEVTNPTSAPTAEVAKETDAQWEQKIAEARAAEQPTPVPAQSTVGNITPQKPDTEKRSDVSRYITAYTGTQEDVNERIKEIPLPSKEAIAAEMQDPSTYLSKLGASLVNGIVTQQQEFLKSCLDSFKKSMGTIVQETMQGLVDSRSHGKMTYGGVELSGEEARLAIVSRSKGVRKLYLYNSGFFVVMRPLPIGELNEIYNTVDSERKEYGRIYGEHFYMLSDLFIKQKVCEIFKRVVVDSNLKNWNVGDTLLSATSLHDYDTILWGMCSLMFRDGIDIGIACTNPECKFKDEIKIDLDKLRVTNFKAMNEAAISFMRVSSHVTLQQVHDYQTNILRLSREVEFEGNVVSLCVPNLLVYLDSSNALIEKMFALIRGEVNKQHTYDNPMFNSVVLINFYKMLAPWISKISYYNENKELSFFVSKAEAIQEHLEVDRLENSDLFDKIITFMKETKLSIFASVDLKCPDCGRVPENNTDNFVPFDMEELFFVLSCRCLELI